MPFDDSLDLKFVDPTDYDDDPTGVDDQRKQQLLQEAINVAISAWVNEKAAENDEERAAALGTIPPAPEPTDEDPEPEDPHAEARAKKEQLLAAAASQREQAAMITKSFQRKKKRLADSNITIPPSMVKDAKKAWLVGQNNAQGQPTSGWLRDKEIEFLQNRANRKAAIRRLALTGAMALNDQERAIAERAVTEAEQNMEIIRGAIKIFRKELTTQLGGSLPSDPEAGAPVGPGNNRSTRRARTQS